MRAPVPVQKDGPRVNEEIFSRTILLIGDDGHKYGEIGTTTHAPWRRKKGFDLVEVSPEAKPPVVKMMDYGKYKYEQQKKANEARKKQKVIEIKEIKMRPTIDDHDYDVKMRCSASSTRATRSRSRCASAAARWRTRIWAKLLERVEEDSSRPAKVEQEPKMEGRQMMMVLAPR